MSAAPRFAHRRVPLLGLIVAGGLLLGGCQDDEVRLESFLENGRTYIENEQHEEAIIEFRNALQIDPENAEAHEALSLAYLDSEQPREAYWEMSETVRLDPDNVDARLRYGTVSAAIGDFDLSREQAEAVLLLDPKSSAAYALRGQSREIEEDFETAESDFRKAVESQPDAPSYRYLLSGYLERRGRSEEAEKVLRELLEVEESYFAMSTLARMLLRTRDRDTEAEAVLEKSIEVAKLAPVEKYKITPGEERGNVSLIKNIERELAVQGAYSLMGGFHYDRGRFDRAIEVLEEGVEESESKVELIYQMALMHRLQGMLEEEGALIQRATLVSPDNLQAQLILSQYLGRKGDIEGALEAARAASAIDADNRAAQLRRAELLLDLGYRDSNADQITEGREIVDAILEEEVDNPEAHFVRAKLFLAENDTDKAKESLQTVLHARPDWAQARFVLGSILAATGELSRARVEVARALEIDPRLLDARKLLARLHSELGEHEFAIEQGRAYLRQRPTDNEVRIIVGQSLIRVGRGEEAYVEVERIPEEQRDAAALFALGRLDLAFGRLELGAERLRKADELRPGNPRVLGALLAIDKTNDTLDASVERIARAVEEFPEDSELAELEADVRELKGDEAGVRTSLERAIALDPRNVSAQLALADFESSVGNIDAMIGIMEGAALASPESSDLQYRLGLAYEKHGRQTDAMDAYEKAISLNRDYGMAKNNLAYLIAETGGDLDRALELAQQAKERMPDAPSAADTLGWVLLKRGVPSAAIGYLQEAAEGFPADAFEVQGIVRNHLATAYELNKEGDKALTESQNAVDHYQSLAKLAEVKGQPLDEPDWSREARERIERLSTES